MAWPTKDQVLDFLGLLFAALLVGVIGYAIVTNRTPPPTIVWDLPGLERELKERVYGQEEAAREILWNIRSLADDPRPTHKQRVVFLLGGPGVGKSHVIDILQKHVHCEVAGNSTCQIKFENTTYFNYFVPGYWIHFEKFYETKGMDVWAAEFNTLDKFINNPEDANLRWTLKHRVIYGYGKIGENDRAIYFVTGRVFNHTVLNAISSGADYDLYLQDAAGRLDDYMIRHAPEVHFNIVTFKPLKKDHVTQCLRDRAEHDIENIVTRNTISDIVPLGCKAH